MTTEIRLIINTSGVVMKGVPYPKPFSVSYTDSDMVVGQRSTSINMERRLPTPFPETIA